MRAREELENEWVDIIVPAGSEGLYKMFLEILLDIRGILNGMREQSLYEKVSEARQEEENRRREQIKERLKPAGGE